MALTDSTRDRLLSLEVASTALSQYVAAAKDNANSDDVQTDPMMKSVRRGFLTVQEIGNEFLSIDRPSGIVRKTGAQIQAAVNSVLSVQSVKDAINALFSATASFSPTQIRSRLLPFIAADNVTPAHIDSLESQLGVTIDPGTGIGGGGA